MSSQRPGVALPDLASQAAQRTIVADTCAHREHGKDGRDHDHDHDHDHEHGHDHDHAFELPEMLRIGFVAAAAVFVWLRLWEPLATVSLIGVVGLAAGGWPIFKEAIENLFAKRMTMELSMSIAIIA